MRMHWRDIGTTKTLWRGPIQTEVLSGHGQTILLKLRISKSFLKARINGPSLSPMESQSQVRLYQKEGAEIALVGIFQWGMIYFL